MKTLKKILLALLVLVVVAAIAGGLFVRQVARKALPDYNRSVFLEGMNEEVRIYRDENAIPHIYASNENDLYMAVGYVMAQDRLWQMDLLRRVTMGRLSEIFGERMIGADQLFRSLRIPEKSDMVIAQSSPERLQAITAFANGVNQFIEMHRKTLPFEFTLLGYKPEPWEPVHSVNLIGYMAWDLSGSWGTEIIMHKLREQLDEALFKELIPDLDYHKTPVYQTHASAVISDLFSLLDHADRVKELGVQVFSGSNSWAVSPQKTNTGFPLFSNDMHLGYGAPGIWYQMHQVVEGGLNVSGVALPGQPLIIVGHNEHIAWGMTNLYVDDIDFYLETINPDNPDQYLLDGEWRNFSISAEQIIVGKKDTVTRENRFTHRGPVISGFRGVENQVISMRWTGNEFSDEFRSIYLLNRASDWDDFRAALTTMTSVSQNITYADIHGNIGQQTAGGVPLRNQETGIFVLPGDTSENDWIGMLDFELLPFEFNPPAGYVSSANNRTVGDDYPMYIGHWFDTPYRIDRIRELLQAKEIVDAAYFKDMLGDAKSKLAEHVTADLVSALHMATDLTDNERTALEALGNWDFVLSRESMAAAVFETLYNEFMKQVLQDEMGADLYRQFGSGLIRNMFDHIMRNPGSAWINNVNTPEQETFEEVLSLSFREAVRRLEDELGKNPDQWQWGRLHHLTISHPLASEKILDRIFGLSRGPHPVSGSFHTIANYSYGFHNPFAVVHGASQRHIFNLADWSDNHMIIPTGISGVPASKYYGNQMEMFVNNDFFRQVWRKDDVVANAKYTALLAPAR